MNGIIHNEPVILLCLFSRAAYLLQLLWFLWKYITAEYILAFHTNSALNGHVFLFMVHDTIASEKCGR